METRYKMRAECQADVGFFLAEVSIISLVASRLDGFPDVVVEFTSYNSMAEIRRALGDIVDGHVMLETVDFADTYTGERREI